MNPRSRKALIRAAILILGGLVIRRAPLHLPSMVSKFGGSLLWGAMVYAIFTAIFPNRRPVQMGVAASLFTLTVELFKLVHTPSLDAFRMTLPGELLRGRFFSFADILAYWVAITGFTAIDNAEN